jgi:hypothetical protein
MKSLIQTGMVILLMPLTLIVTEHLIIWIPMMKTTGFLPSTKSLEELAQNSSQEIPIEMIFLITTI